MKHDRTPIVGLVVDRHHPARGCLMPEQAWIAPPMPHDRIPAELGPGSTMVVAIDDALASARAGEGRDQGRRLLRAEARRGAAVDHGAAREAPVAVLPRIQGDRQLPPVDQVTAYRVAPVHVSPVPAIGVVLV